MREKQFKKSILLSVIAIAAYIVCLIFDIRFLLKWNGYGEMDSALGVFVPLILLHLIFPVLAILWFRKGKNAGPEGKKSPASAGAIIALLITALVAWYAYMTANTMVDYVYKSKNGRGDMTLEEFQRKATLPITSADLHDGVWDAAITNTSRGENCSPQLSFDAVEGASYYVIYMVDETANNWVHWYAEVPGTELSRGANPGSYVGPYPPRGSGPHTYTIYVYALSGPPGILKYDGAYPEFDRPWLGADALWSGVLNIKDNTKHPILYGNVLAYGYIEGTYES